MKNLSKSDVEIFIHPLADVHTTQIGNGSVIWQFSVILEGAKIGSNCNINCHTFIEAKVEIGDNVTIKSGCYLWDGITIENNVLVGPNVVFTNDLRPRSKKRVIHPQTKIGEGASIGANSTILGGVTIGKYAMTGIASVVTRDIPDYALVYGNPARVKGWVDETGEKLISISPTQFISNEGIRFELSNNMLKRLP
jgi:acetyltransferase-like isoleucine patch superfamily enzyme